MRRRLLLLGLVPLAVALVLLGKVAAMTAFDERGLALYASGDFGAAGAAFGANGVVNVLEPWVSPFDEGTASYRAGEYADARRLLVTALGTVPAAQECRVRVNLALTVEALGDAALASGELERAEALWTEGVATLDAVSCRQEPAGADAVTTAGVSVGERLLGKVADRSVEEPPDPPEADPEAQVDELEQRNDDAQQQHRDNEETREDPPPPADPAEPADPPTYSW